MSHCADPRYRLVLNPNYEQHEVMRSCENRYVHRFHRIHQATLLPLRRTLVALVPLTVSV